MKIRILGCGTSTGVPKIGNHWGQCDPSEPRNRRLRSSILVDSEDAHVLVDCGPDLRQQLLDAGVDRLEAVIVTHDHGDHVHGIDELRPVSQAMGRPVPLLGRQETLDSLGDRFAYAFVRSEFYRPIVAPGLLGQQWSFGGVTVRTIDQPHGTTSSVGLRFEKDNRSAIYAIDYSAMTGDMRTLYQGADVMISDCLTRHPHPTHAHLDGVLAWARELQVSHLYLTHMGNGLDYRTLIDELPDWAEPAYDGQEICL